MDATPPTTIVQNAPDLASAPPAEATSELAHAGAPTAAPVAPACTGAEESAEEDTATPTTAPEPTADGTVTLPEEDAFVPEPANVMVSVLLEGPPGVGKRSIARLLAEQTRQAWGTTTLPVKEDTTSTVTTTTTAPPPGTPVLLETVLSQRGEAGTTVHFFAADVPPTGPQATTAATVLTRSVGDRYVAHQTQVAADARTAGAQDGRFHLVLHCWDTVSSAQGPTPQQLALVKALQPFTVSQPALTKCDVATEVELHSALAATNAALTAAELPTLCAVAPGALGARLMVPPGSKAPAVVRPIVALPGMAKPVIRAADGPTPAGEDTASDAPVTPRVFCVTGRQEATFTWGTLRWDDAAHSDTAALTQALLAGPTPALLTAAITTEVKWGEWASKQPTGITGALMWATGSVVRAVGL